MYSSNVHVVIIIKREGIFGGISVAIIGGISRNKPRGISRTIKTHGKILSFPKQLIKIFTIIFIECRVGSFYKYSWIINWKNLN